jgi:hypothetical protein
MSLLRFIQVSLYVCAVSTGAKQAAPPALPARCMQQSSPLRRGTCAPLRASPAMSQICREAVKGVRHRDEGSESLVWLGRTVCGLSGVSDRCGRLLRLRRLPKPRCKASTSYGEQAASRKRRLPPSTQAALFHRCDASRVCVIDKECWPRKSGARVAALQKGPSLCTF